MEIDERNKKNVFKKIFEDNWKKFKELNPSYDRKQYNDVIEKMLDCGSELGGYAEYRCLDCGQDFRRVAFSCKSMFCLSCTKVYMDNFVSKVSEMLHPGMRYRHVILTVPEQLKRYFYKDRFEGKLLKKLFKIGYECLKKVTKSVFRKELKIGIIVVLQTYGRSGTYNPHLHVIMTNAGMNEKNEKWNELRFIPYEILHKQWQYHLLKMVKKEIGTHEIIELVDKLYIEYPKGFVANISRGEAPREKSGLAVYLAKYIASPPISVKRIFDYDGKKVTYCYREHRSGKIKKETVDVLTFIGRMVQHVLPKGFQRVRYYGMQATRTLKLWREQVKAGVKKLKKKIMDVYEIVEKLSYRERYTKGCGRDPFICRCCGGEMVLSVIWHPKYGVIFDELERVKKGYYEKRDRGRGYSVWPTSKDVQLSMF